MGKIIQPLALCQGLCGVFLQFVNGVVCFAIGGKRGIGKDVDVIELVFANSFHDIGSLLAQIRQSNIDRGALDGMGNILKTFEITQFKG